MQTDRNPIERAGTDYGLDGEPVFRQWATRRLTLYQDLGRHVQSTVTDLLQLASEFTIRMEEETNQLVERYRREQAQVEAQVEGMRREMDELRAQMDQDYQVHMERLRGAQQQQEVELARARQQQEEMLARTRQQEEEDLARQREELVRQRRDQEDELTRQREDERESLARQRQQQEDELAQLRQRALNAMEEQMRMAHEERDQMLREAYAERNRVFAQTRQLSMRLAELQQALQGLAGVSAYQSEAGAQWQDEPRAAQAPAEPQTAQAQPAAQLPQDSFDVTAGLYGGQDDVLGAEGVTGIYVGTAESITEVEDTIDDEESSADDEAGDGEARYGDVATDEDEASASLSVDDYDAYPTATDEELASLFELDENLEEEGGAPADGLLAPAFEDEEPESSYDLDQLDDYDQDFAGEGQAAEPSLADELFAPSFETDDDEEGPAYDAGADAGAFTFEEFSYEEPAIAEDESGTLVAGVGAQEEFAPEPEAATETAENPRRLVIEGVTRFTLASDLIDRLEQSPTIRDVDLLLYEQTTLLLYVQHDEDVALEALLRQELGDVLEVVQSKPDVIHLRVRM